MDKKMVTNILERLEFYYPELRSVVELANETGYESDSQFYQALAFLNETNRIYYDWKDPNKKDRRNDSVRVLPEGIKYLSEIKLLKSQEYNNEIMTYATIAIALTAVFQLISALYGGQTTILLINQLSYYGIFVMGVMAIFFLFTRLKSKLRFRK